MSVSRPEVSVIMPVYNVEKYLRAALDSILTQDIAPGSVEIIAVNDGSTDSSPEILAEYARNYPSVKVLSIPNSGLSAARNAALDVAEGTYIMFCDSDDELLQGCISRSIDILKRNKADLVIYDFIYSVDRPSADVLTISKVKELAYSSQDAIESMLYQHPRPINGAWMWLVKRDIFQQAPQLRFCEGLYYEDLELAPRLFERCSKIVVADFKGYFYRKRPGSITMVLNKTRFDVLKVTLTIEERYRATSPTLAKAAADRRFSANFNILLLLLKYGNGEYQNIIDQTWRLVRKYRFKELFNPKIRLKNRLGAVATLAGLKMIKFLAKRARIN